MIKVCVNCGHPIRKRYFTLAGSSMWEWTHSRGGKYCHASKGFPELGDCLCISADYKEVKDVKRK